MYTHFHGSENTRISKCINKSNLALNTKKYMLIYALNAVNFL